MARQANVDLHNALEALRPLTALYGENMLKWLIDLPIWPLPAAPEPADDPPKQASEDLLRTLQTLQTLIARYPRSKVKGLVEVVCRAR